jgi:ATP-dependent DNA helicase RecG
MVDFKILEHEDKRVLIFIIASRPIGMPVQVDGVAWCYEGDSLIPMREEIRRSIYTENVYDFSSSVCRSATLADLDENAIFTFRKKWVTYSSNKRIETLSIEQLMRDCGAITDDGVTYAALILFGTKRAILKLLPRSEVIFEYRSSEASGPAAQREEFSEGFFNYYDRIWDTVNLRNDKQHYQDGLFIFPIYTFNERVVREALLNAVSHRDYQLAGSVFVRQYRDKLVLENPGGFPYGITVENILDRQSPRNLLIAKIFQLCGLVERSGQGMNLIYENSIREAKPLPDFDGTDDYFVRLTLSGNITNKQLLSILKKIGDERLAKMTTDDYILLSKLFNDKNYNSIPSERFTHLVELGIAEQTESGIRVADNEILSVANRSLSVGATDRRQAIVNYLKINGQVKTRNLLDVVGLSDGRVRALLRNMVEEGTIEKVGDKRYTSYKLSEN